MAKLSGASIRFVLKKNRLNRLGEYPIYIVVCFGGRVEKATGVSCSERNWDARLEMVKRSQPNAPVLNKMLQDIKGKVISRKNEFEYNGRVYTPSMLLEDSVIDFSAKDNLFKSLMDSLIAERRLKFKTANRYKYAFNKISEYLGRKNFIIDELNLGFVKDFLKWLNVGDGTKRDICSSIASIWNYAIDKKITDGSDYPFNEFKFATKLKNGVRDYFLDRSHIVRLKEYWLNLVCTRNGELWHYNDGAFDRLHKRYSKEFGILWFLLCYKLNGSAPIEIAFLKATNCSRVQINGEDYWAIDFKRQKTGTDVAVRWKRDLFSIIALEHFMGFSSNGFVYPIMREKNVSDVQMQRSCNKASELAIKAVREAFEEINAEIIKENVEKGIEQPLVEVDKVVMYTARHSLSNHLLSSKDVSVRELAGILSRSPNTISVYINSLLKNKEIADISTNMAI